VTASQQKELARLFHAVAKQRYYLGTRRADKKLESEGWRFFYAVDTDVIILYTNPTDEAVPTQRRKEGYTHIFPGDSPDLSVSLGRFLADFIFEQLDPDHPILSIPPMDQELQRVVGDLVQKAEVEHGNVAMELKQLHVELEKLKLEGETRSVLERLDRLAPNLHTILAGGKGPSVQLARIGHLMSTQCIVPLDFALDAGRVNNPTLSALWKEIGSFQTRVTLHGLRERWFDRLRFFKSEAKVSSSVYDDAAVLAHLEWINLHLAPEKCRLLYLTGDRSIFRAAQDYYSDGMTHSFAELCLRHPRSYLVEPAILFPGDYTEKQRKKQGQDFHNWLDTFLALSDSKQQEQLHPIHDDSEGAHFTADAAEVLKRQPGILGEFYQQWTEYTKNISLAHGPGTVPEHLGRFDPLAELRVATRSLREILDRLGKVYDERVTETWETLFVTATEAGWWLQKHRSVTSQIPPRNTPVLSFKSLPIAKELVDHFIDDVLASRLKKTDIQNSQYSVKLKQLKDEDPSRYSVFLIYALLFAAEGNWHITVILSRRALDIARNSPKWNISGREAAYLQAVALRHGSRCVNDLDKVDEMLDLASQLFAKDREQRSELTGGAIRFDAERLAVSLTRHHFRLFTSQDSGESGDLPSLTELERSFRSLLEDEARFNAEEDSKIRKTTERNLLTNLFMTALLRWGKAEETLDPSHYQDIMNRFRVNMASSQEKPQVVESFLVRLIFMVTDWWLEFDDIEKRKKRRDIHKFMNQKDIKSKCVFPYDENRFNFLLGLTAQQ